MDAGQGIHRAVWALILILAVVAAALGYAYVDKERAAEGLQAEIRALQARTQELEATLAAARAGLERTRKSFEQVQALIAPH